MTDNPSYLPTPPTPGDSQGLKPGDIFWNNYRVIGAIGRGGVSTVYKAENIQDRQLVAIKVLHAHKARDEELVRRFVRECQTTSKLDHPHAIKILEWGIDQLERPFMIIEYLNGDTLSRRIQRSNGLNYTKAVEIMEQVCSAVAEAHSLGIVHRDLKPENIMLTTHNGLEDWVKVVDFGIAKLEPITEEGIQAKLTQTGAILGTPLYMSPEQLRGRTADARCDIYALGIIMYEMLTGNPPFSSHNTAEIVVGHLNVIPEAPSKVRMDLSIPEVLDAAVIRALAKNPWERQTTVQEFCASLLKSIDKSDRKQNESSSHLNINNTPTPQGMIVDPVLKVCPTCKTLSKSSNYRYCLKCGQDNTNRWLPYHTQEPLRLGFNWRLYLMAKNRRIFELSILAVLIAWVAFCFFNPPELTGKFSGKFDHPLFSNIKTLPPTIQKHLTLSEMEFLLSQSGDNISGLISSQIGQDDIIGTRTNINALRTSYDLNSNMQLPEGRLNLWFTGSYDTLMRSYIWTVKATFLPAKISNPVSDFAHMSLKPVTE